MTEASGRVLIGAVHHHAIKIAYWKEKLDEEAICTAYTKTTLMVLDCTNKPVNGAQLSTQVSCMIGQFF
jgi:hypothetical protein